MAVYRFCAALLIYQGYRYYSPSNTACTRLSLRAEFQSYFRVVIVFRGASVVRRIRPAGDAYVSTSQYINGRMSIFHQKRFTYYLIITGILPIILFYPAMIYGDLSGMGGYDGFATPAMMERYGAWSETEEMTVGYLLFTGLHVVWLISLVNLPLAGVLACIRWWTKRRWERRKG